MANQVYHKRDLCSEVTTRILAELETGAAPWVKPWSASPGRNHPHNAASGRPYSGCNVVLLWMAAQRHGWAVPSYVTFKQALELGGHVRKGEHGSKVYFVKRLEVRDKDAGPSDDPRIIPMMREYTVFNVAQCEGLPNRITAPSPKARTASETLIRKELRCANLMHEMEHQTMMIGYARVSTEGQTLDSQQATLRGAGAERVFAEKVSGIVTDRKQLAKAIASLAQGDVLLVT